MLKKNTNLLHKFADDLSKMEALFFMSAGFISNHKPEDPYVQKLREEFLYLIKLHCLSRLSNIEWKFLHMGPYNFTAFRIA